MKSYALLFQANLHLQKNNKINQHDLEVRSFSSCDEFTIEKVIKKIPKATLTFNIGNYVTVVYRNYWWLALVKKLIKITKK